MSEEEIHVKNRTSGAVVFFLTVALMAIGYLAYSNYELKQKVEYLVEMNEEFHENLYATVQGTYNDGAHSLSISDVYYRKYFDKKDDNQ